MRVLLGAFGDPGHAFPMLALGSALVDAGHEVGIQTWRKWSDAAADAGMTFSAAPEYHRGSSWAHTGSRQAISTSRPSFAPA